MTGSYFDYSEVLKYAKKLGIASDELTNWLKEFLLTQAQRVVAEAKKRQRAVGAIDTGAMINSWAFEDVKVRGKTLEVTIYNPMEYASFIEFGQRSYTGKYLLTIGIDTVQRALPNRFKSEWNKFLKNKGLV